MPALAAWVIEQQEHESSLHHNLHMAWFAFSTAAAATASPGHLTAAGVGWHPAIVTQYQ
jgi:hypothetical protein